MQSSIRVLIADDRPRSRKGMKALLSTWSEVEVVGEVLNGHEAVDFCEIHKPDVVLMDAQMPVKDGIKATRCIKDKWPEIKVIVLSIYRTYEEDAREAGADAFFEKGCPTKWLLNAITEP
ncbi:MAG: response regulator [Anaerolineales bacterium]|nr:response regulator [Anaerolineales bacterium]